MALYANPFPQDGDCKTKMVVAAILILGKLLYFANY